MIRGITTAIVLFACVSNAHASVFILDNYDEPANQQSSDPSNTEAITNANGGIVPDGADSRTLFGRGSVFFNSIPAALVATGGNLSTNIFPSGEDLSGAPINGPASTPDPFIEMSLPTATDIGGFKFLDFLYSDGSGTLSVDASTDNGLNFNPVALGNNIVDGLSSGNYGFSGGTVSGVTNLRITFVSSGLAGRDGVGAGNTLNFSSSALQATPEPTSVALLGCALFAGIGLRRRRRECLA